MAEANPEFIFVLGPQTGLRTVVMKSPAVAGRVASCEVHVAEEFVSRHQFRLELTADGWVMENLSVNGTRVNGRKFKTGKKVLLDSGDVLGMGKDTEILFVAPGDDPDQVLFESRSAHPAEAEGPAPPPVPEDRGETEQPAEQPAEQAQASQRDVPPGAPEGPDEEITDEQRERKAKIRKYVIFGAVWGVALIALIIVLSMVERGGTIVSSRPRQLSKHHIAEALREDIERNKNLQAAAERLRKAVSGYGTGKWFRPGELQECVKNFKLHLAYLGRPDFDNPRHSLMYKDARDRLTDKVQKEYWQGWIREQDGRWAGADEIWQRLMRVIPRDQEWNTPGYERLQKNIMAHAAYVRRHLRKK